MITPWEIYWILKLDTFVEVTTVLSVVSGIAFLCLLVPALIEPETTAKIIKKFLFYRLLPLFLITTPFAIFLPTTKEMIAILAIPKVLNIEHVQAIPEKTVELLDAELTKLLEDFKKEKK